MSEQPPDNGDHDDDGDSDHRTLMALAAVVLLVVATVFLMLKLKHGLALEDCFAAGHHNCAPIDTSKM